MPDITNGSPRGNFANGSAGPPVGAAASGSGAYTRRQPLQHIDDVTSVTIDFDRFTQMDKLLTKAEDLLREAETFRNFGGRIDMAMKSYLKANILLLDVVKKNKGWVSLAAGDNKAQKKRYDELLRQVKATQGVFEQIKLDIKNDNARSGVLPTERHSTNTEGSGLAVLKDNKPSLDDGGSDDEIHSRAPSPGRSLAGPSIHPNQATSATPAKARPSVRPKPEALHGNAVQSSAAKKAAEDLSKRFANLRPPKSAPQQLIQDPRIRTQPIIVPPVTQRRDVGVATSRSSLSLESDGYELPKMPGAIYKPARGTVSTEAAELPSSSSRRFSLARSLTAGSINSPSVKSPPASTGEESTDWPKRTKLIVPEGETISVTELLRLMKEGSKSVSILLIDIRSREAFDEGHIMSQATICIEPEVLIRKNISANEIAESMVLAPSTEQINFERRHGFDLVVFYDQNSTQIGTTKSNSNGAAVQGLFNALTYFDFVGENSPNPPKLLEGGLDAWTSVMGNNSLATTETSVNRPLGPSTKVRHATYTPHRRQSHVPKPIQDPEEARWWEQSTNDPELFKPISQDDFLRRFPSVSIVKESMVLSSPSIRTVDGNYSVSPPHHIPAEPKRPAPTVAKTSFSGFNGEDEHDKAKATRLVSRPQGEKAGTKRRVGLRNPGNLCYANSSLQALFGTPGFATDLATGAWADDYVVPMKSDEKIPNPQLLAKMLSQLFGWMDKALIHPMEARTLMQYTSHVHGTDERGRRRPAHEIFGGNAQQDAQEFFSYLLEVLDDETNKFRDRGNKVGEIPDDDPRSMLHNAVRYWQMFTAKNNSIVTKYWRGLDINVGTCTQCPYRTTRYSAFDITTCNIRPKRTLQASLEYNGREQQPDEFWCPKCKEAGRGNVQRVLKTTLCRLPDRLTFQVNRFTNNGMRKDNSSFEFPIRDLDMEPYWVPPPERHILESDQEALATARTDRHFRPPFKYDCYAVICHIGETLKSGHYIAYVRDHTSRDPTDWIKFDDTHVTPVKVGSGGKDETEMLYGSGRRNQQAYLLFYQRRET